MEFNKDLGPEAKLHLAVEKGKLIFTLKHEGASGAEDITIEEDIGYFLDQLVAKIPDGTVKSVFASAVAVAKGALQNL